MSISKVEIKQHGKGSLKGNNFLIFFCIIWGEINNYMINLLNLESTNLSPCIEKIKDNY